jgi:dipeptidyl aminopeptidase/acylaminoacyl peptidase
MPGRIALLLVLPVLMISPPRAAAAELHPFNVRDLIAMDRLSEPVASPDGRYLALTISALVFDANRRRADIWVVRTDGTDLRRLTNDPANDTSPAWHRDGRRVFFLSARSGSTQVRSTREPRGTTPPAMLDTIPSITRGDVETPMLVIHGARDYRIPYAVLAWLNEWTATKS